VTPAFDMDTVFVFKNSSFKHGVSREAIVFAFTAMLYDGLLEGEDNKYLRIGFDGNGNLLEILYNIIDDRTVNVFHADKCRTGYISLIAN